MKKRLFVFIFLALVVVFVFNENRSEENLIENNLGKKENLLSMMVEQTAGASDYVLETRSSWPTKNDGYIFNETLSRCENGSKLSWNEETCAVTFSGNVSDKCYIYFDVYIPTLAEYVIAQYTGVQGENNIYYHNGTILGEDGSVLDANDGSYRYAGSSDTTNNFVCFGSDEETCPDDNLYRIIGVFGDQAKLIKWNYANSDLLGTDGDYKSSATYYWSKANIDASKTATGYSNDWSYSELNKTNLNKNYLTNIGDLWSNKIAMHNWIVGGIEKIDIPSVIYKNEITSPLTQVTSTYKAKIGLMYISDYGFAISSSAWSTSLGVASYSTIVNDNWMYMGRDEWTITRSTNSLVSVVSSYGPVGEYDMTVNLTVRPVFYLNSNVTKVGNNTGTKSDPIRIN